MKNFVQEPLRVLQVLPALQSGGVEQNTLDLIHTLHVLNQNVEHHVVSQGGDLVATLMADGTHHHNLPLKSKNPLIMARNAWKLKQLIEQFHIHIIHARSRGPAWPAWWAAHQCKIPFVTTYHGTYNANNPFKRFYNSIMARGDLVIAISDFMKSHILGEHKHLQPPIEVIHEGIDVVRFNPKNIAVQDIQAFRQRFGIKDHQKLLLLVGRLTRWKGQRVLLESAKFLDPKAFVILFIGDDQGRLQYKNELSQLADAFSMPVHFLKDFHPLETAYASADIVVSCSTDPEAFGRVTAEALSMERPFIGTHHGATIELTGSGKYGDLVTQGDALQLAKAIEKLATDNPQEIKNKGKAARCHIIQNYSLETMAQKTLHLYQSLL